MLYMGLMIIVYRIYIELGCSYNGDIVYYGNKLRKCCIGYMEGN
jgi:hypothetical protein